MNDSKKKKTGSEGLRIDQTVGAPLRSGNYLYWDAQLQQIVQADLGRFCPEVSHISASDGVFSAEFRQNSLGTQELCRNSIPISDWRARIPEGELEEFVAAIDAMHQKAKERNVVGDSARFIRDFRVPDPREMPEAWRVSPGRPGHLLVLWGFAGSPTAAVLPLTETSKAWPDADRRVDLCDALKSALLKRSEKPRSNSRPTPSRPIPRRPTHSQWNWKRWTGGWRRRKHRRGPLRYPWDGRRRTTWICT